MAAKLDSISLRIPVALRRRLERLGRRRYKSLSEMMREALVDYAVEYERREASEAKKDAA